ncbi:defects in morphology protein 1 [Colletotrichum abscissum]|uniref:Defects in morphology protein 1 n=1 Tax=Colletotrichum abscissum TaxID=1671311 RepID=A0A9P9XNI5_9PEZI|nr:defects in morphology protein 1 [Colletotrichum abscissum]KAI3557168.1 defects in morphology protein 1 [Colletotrichum abscissum]KAK1499986.1 defects in morphology protein 1 [Colletotrichum abscissum]
MSSSFSLDSDDEYGYDLSLEDETLLSQLITDNPAPTSTSSRNPAAPSIASDFGIDTVAEQEFCLDDAPTDLLSYRTTGTAKGSVRPSRSRSKATLTDDTKQADLPSASPGHSVAYPDLSRALSNNNIAPSSPKPNEKATPDPENDARSPLVRFRSYPRKPFTVTDLTSGAWCELQYFYTLTRLPYGRKTRTAAMKQGTKVHQDLEDEVHTTVRVEIASKEDGFGLRMWNLIQGLRTLRETGMTRELEVWGFADGNLVNGVIDGLSYENPDPEFMEQLSQESEQNQSSITDYFPSKKQANIPQIYLTDVKTRGSMKAPNSPALLRPAKVQLFLYQRFLSEMAADKLDYLRIFRRYGLDPDEPFSDSFIAQIGSLHDELFFDMDSSPDEDYIPLSPTTATVDAEADDANLNSSAPDFIKYRTLRELLPLLVSELRQTFPHGADSVGRLLTVEYRYRGDGSLIDSQVFPMDDRALNLYLGNTMEWWRADRQPRGVQIEEAYKCRMCEFVGDCTWRSAMDEERLQSTRQRLAGRSKHNTSG